jgi:hypothetical protein
VIVGVVLLSAFPWRTPMAQSVEELVEEVIATYGGAEKLASVTAVRQWGQLVSFRRGGSIARVERTLELPDRLRIEIAYPGEPDEVRILDREFGWRRAAEAPQPLYDSMLLQAARLSVPYILPAVRAELRDQGFSTDREGREIRVLELPLRHDLSLFIEIDSARHLIRRTRGTMLVGRDPVMEFSAEYHEHRMIEGVLVAMREEQFAMGRHIGYTTLDTVEFPDQVPPGSFVP